MSVSNSQVVTRSGLEPLFVDWRWEGRGSGLTLLKSTISSIDVVFRNFHEDLISPKGIYGNIDEMLLTILQRSSSDNKGKSPSTLILDEGLRYAQDTTERVLDLLDVLGWRAAYPTLAVKSTFFYYYGLYLSGQWASVVKNVPAYLFAKGEDQDLPPLPSACGGYPQMTFGHLDRYLQRKTQGRGLNSRECRFTVLQGFKKSLLPLDWRKTITTLQEHGDALDKTPHEPFEAIRAAVFRTAREVSRRKAPRRWDGHRVSTHACLESGRETLGFLGQVHNVDGIDYRDSPCGLSAVESQLYKFRGEPELIGYSYWKGKVIDFYNLRFEYAHPGLSFEECFFPGQSLLGDKRVQVVTIPEAAKIRVISLGSYDAYNSLRPYQQQMWGALQRFWNFHLTGSGNDYLEHYVQSIVCQMKKGWTTISGDYKAATDNLNGELTAIAVNGFYHDDLEAQLVAQNALSNCPMEYPSIPVLDGQVEPWELEKTIRNQEDGQLMGCPLSFPILCIINMAIVRLSYEWSTGQKCDIESVPVLVNGDDCLFTGPSSIELIWETLAGHSGLTKSVGKSYSSRSFAMINSRYFAIDQTGSVPTVRYDLGYVNMGILQGRKKGNHESCEVNPRHLRGSKSEFLAKFIQSTEDNWVQSTQRVKTLDLSVCRDIFVRAHKTLIESVRLPINLPRSMGGIGLVVPGEPWIMPTAQAEAIYQRAGRPVSFTEILSEQIGMYEKKPTFAGCSKAISILHGNTRLDESYSYEFESTVYANLRDPWSALGDRLRLQRWWEAIRSVEQIRKKGSWSWIRPASCSPDEDVRVFHRG